MGRRGKRLVLVAIPVVLAVAALTWHGVAAARRGDVTIVQGGGLDGVAITCADGQPKRRHLHGVGRGVVMRAQPGMDCRMPVVVTNESSGTVRLESIAMPYMGPSSGAQVQVTELEGLPRIRKGSHGGLDAVFRVDRDLEPGEAYRVTVGFTFREKGCNDGTLWFTDFPRFRVSSLGLDGEVPGGAVAFRADGSAPGCGHG